MKKLADPVMAQYAKEISARVSSTKSTSPERVRP